MLSVLAFMIFSQASELHQRSQKEIQQFNQLQRTITILDNDLLQLVAQVKRHLFPYSRYFTLSTESISDEQSQGWQSHIFFNRKQQSAQIYRRTLQLY